MKRILLVGASLNSGNRGVNALTRAQIMLIFDKLGVDSDIKILSYTVKEKTENYVEYNGDNILVEEIPCGKKEMLKAFMGSHNYIIDYILQADYIWDISEGDSFSDIYGIKRFIQHSLIKLIAIKKKKKLIIMPQTLGPYKNKLVQKAAKYILENADKVFVRDELSKEIAEKELGVKREITYKPDMAFYIKPSNKIDIHKFIEKDKINIGINVSALLYNGGYNGRNMFNLKVNYKNLVYRLIEELSKIENVEILLVPHVLVKDIEVEDDYRVSKKIAEELTAKLNKKIKTIDDYYREDELKAIIRGCDFFIGSRMHACIGAISTIVPTSPMAYSRKFIGIWEKIGLGYCVTDPRKQDEEEIIQVIIENFNNRRKIKDKLEEEIPLLIKNIGSLVDELEE